MADPTDPALVDRVFDAVADVPPAERAGWLDEHCPDPAVRAEVEQLLDYMERSSGALEQPLTLRGPADHPEAIGPYRVLEVLGSGGMGVVYLAEQPEPRRRVAIKVMHRGLLAGELRRRFEREAELLGRLQHEGVAQVFELGGTAAGETYLVMEYVPGVPITDYARDRRLGVPAKVELLRQLAAAVHHAHLRGVVHRDLKPANVLVTDEGRVRVIDFGVARLTDRGVGTLATAAGEVIGTLAYMSPEQARGDVDAVDARADVYALGVIAYELLSGRLPHRLRSGMLAEAARILAEEEPPRLGTVSRACRGDLELIVGKALEKEPARRYPSASALAADLQRFEHDEPIEARPPSALYQLSKIARRHRAGAVGAAVALVGLVVGGGVAAWLAVQNAALARDEAAARRAAERAAEDARASEQRALDEAARADAAAGELRARVRDLRDVADYQSHVLNGLDPRWLGERIEESLVDGLRRELELEGRDPLHVAERQATLRAALERVNPTDVALEVMDQAIFRRSLAAIDERFQENELQAGLYLALGDVASDFALYELAAEAYARVAPDGTDLAPTGLVGRACAGRGRALAGQDRYAEAVAWLDHALAIYAEVDGPDADRTRYAEVNLAKLLRQVGDVARAEELLREALRPRDRSGLDEVDLAAVEGLAPLLVATGRAEEAEGTLREAIALASAEGAADARLALGLMRQLGATLVGMGRMAEAEEVHREVVEGRRALLGDDHPVVIEALEDLAFTLLQQGRLDEVQPILVEVVAGWRARYGSAHERTAIPLRNLAVVYLTTGRSEQALPVAEEAYVAARELWRPDDPRRRERVRILHDACAYEYDRTPTPELAARLEELRAELGL